MQTVGVGIALGIATAAAGAAQAAAQRRSASFMAVQYKEQAQQEVDAANDREIERRRRLVADLALQNAEGGALGATPGVGSRAAIALADAKRASYESLADRASSNRRALTLSSAARYARTQGDWQAGGTLLDTAVSAYRVGGR